MLDEKGKSISNIILAVFINIFIISIYFRLLIYKSYSIDVRYYYVATALIVLLLFWEKSKISGINFVLVLYCTTLILLGGYFNGGNLTIAFKALFVIIFPLIILTIRDLDISNMERKDIFLKINKVFSIFMYISFIISVFQFVGLVIESGDVQNRVGGICGHPITSGIYYCIYILFNHLENERYKTKSDVQIIIDIGFALIGVLLTGSRMATIAAIAMALIYGVMQIKNAAIKYIFVPMTIVALIASPIFYNIVWYRFEESKELYNDVSNGRFLVMEGLEKLDIKANTFLGMGNGYSVYITQEKLGLLSPENPLIMFQYDYGLVFTGIFYILILVIPLVMMLIKKTPIIALQYLILFATIHTFNGIAEASGILYILCFIIFIINLVTNNEGIGGVET